MKASALEQSGRHQEALAIFSEIFPFLSADSKRTVRRHQGSCHYLGKDFQRAYAAFREGINPYKDDVEPEYLFQYAFVAAIEGQPSEAERALEMLLFLVDPKDSGLSQKATELRSTIQSNGFKDIGWF
jgi:tetratricopeptide (TPR) repeat protein